MIYHIVKLKETHTLMGCISVLLTCDYESHRNKYYSYLFELFIIHLIFQSVFTGR